MSWELVESLALPDLPLPMELAGAEKMESWVTRSPCRGWCHSIYLEPLESASAKVRGNMGWWETVEEPPKALGFHLVPRLASSGVCHEVRFTLLSHGECVSLQLGFPGLSKG